MFYLFERIGPTGILSSELIPDQIINWKRLNNNRAFPSWWGAFKHGWKIASDRDIGSEDDYLTDVSNCQQHLLSV